MKVLLTGSHGQVGRELVGSAPASARVVACSRAELDICDATAVMNWCADVRPDVIINASAYTAVDKAESDSEAARRGNAEGPRNLALAAREHGARLLHISTDFVFDGAANTPYAPDAATNPLNVYGATKLQGEEAIRAVLPENSLVLRTAWVYSRNGANFVRTMLRLMGDGKTVRVIADQIGTPTSARSLADVLWKIAPRADLNGVHHWTDAGVATWYDFAVAIAEEGAACGVLPAVAQVVPITTADYPTPARRPAFSVLDKRSTLEALHLTSVHWRAQLRLVLREMVNA